MTVTADRLVLLPPERPHADPDCRSTFSAPRLIMTPGAVVAFGPETIAACLFRLQQLARQHGGLDFLQVFEHPETRAELWFIEDAPGVVTALLPEDR